MVIWNKTMLKVNHGCEKNLPVLSYLLLDAISEDRGATIINGHYPVTNEIIERLRKIGLRR